MALAERLAEDMKQAMRSKDKMRLSVLRLVKAAIRNTEIDKKITLGDEEIVGILRKEVKQRKETMATIETSGRDDLIEELKLELEILGEYLPAEMDEAQIELLVQEVIREVGATSKADLGKVMPVVMKRIGGQAEGRTINRIVQQVLGNL